MSAALDLATRTFSTLVSIISVQYAKSEYIHSSSVLGCPSDSGYPVVRTYFSVLSCPLPCNPQVLSLTLSTGPGTWERSGKRQSGQVAFCTLSTRFRWHPLHQDHHWGLVLRCISGSTLGIALTKTTREPFLLSEEPVLMWSCRLITVVSSYHFILYFFYYLVSKNDSILEFNFEVWPLYLLEDSRLGWFYSGVDWNETGCWVLKCIISGLLHPFGVRACVVLESCF